MRPYVSIDIETTGVDTNHAHILELGAVLDDGIRPLEELPFFSAIIHHDVFSYATPFALNMNQRLIKAILGKDGQPAAQVFKQFVMFLNDASALANRWDEANGKKPTSRISLAGKNAAVFDIPILDKQISLVSEHYAEDFKKIRNHRVIDVGSMYYKQFGYVPTLEEIKQKIGTGTEVSHCAVEDAMDVVKAIRAS